MQHRITLSKALLIAVKNRKFVGQSGVIVDKTTAQPTGKKYSRYTTIAGNNRKRVEEIYN